MQILQANPHTHFEDMRVPWEKTSEFRPMFFELDPLQFFIDADNDIGIMKLTSKNMQNNS